MPSIMTYCMTWFCLNIQRAYILLSGFNLAYRHFEREVNFSILWRKINKSAGLKSKQDVLDLNPLAITHPQTFIFTCLNF